VYGRQCEFDGIGRRHVSLVNGRNDSNFVEYFSRRNLLSNGHERHLHGNGVKSYHDEYATDGDDYGFGRNGFLPRWQRESDGNGWHNLYVVNGWHNGNFI
jgi:hypothetical protein